MKSSKNTIPSQWETKRLSLSDTVIDESNALQAIYEEGWEEVEWIGKQNKPKRNYFKKYIENPELPPKGKINLHRLQTIRLKKDKSIVGYLDVYHGWPKKNILWVGDLFLYSNSAGKKYGREIIDGLVKETKKFGYEYMRCSVRLKNWSAIRFWARVGFSKIVGYLGDKEYSTNKFADLILEKDTSGSKTSEWME